MAFWNHSNLISRFWIRRIARLDARVGVKAGEPHSQGSFGPCPKFDPSSNLEDAQIEKDSKTEAKVDAVATEEGDLRKEYNQHGRPGLRTFGIGGLLGIEVAGALLLLREMGVPTPERTFLAMGLATFLWFVAHKVTELAPGEGRWRWVWFGLWSVVAIALIISIGALRSTAGAEAGLAGSIVYVAFSGGPALLIEWLMERRKPAILALRRLNQKVAELKEAKRRLDTARAAMVARARAQVWWTDQYSMFVNVYQSAWWREAARRENAEKATQVGVVQAPAAVTVSSLLASTSKSSEPMAVVT